MITIIDRINQMIALKVFKIIGFVVLSWSVLLMIQYSNLDGNVDNDSHDKMISMKITERVSSKPSVPDTLEKVPLPCDEFQKSADFICEAYILSKLKSDIDADSLEGLQLVWRFYRDFKGNGGIDDYLEPLKKSDDIRLAKLSYFILHNLNADSVTTQENLTRQVIGVPVENLGIQNLETENYQVITELSTSASLLDEAPIYEEGDIQRIMYSSESHVRLKAVEIATMQADDHAIELLKQAAKDSDASIRQLAVAGLSEFIAMGLSDPQDILNALEENKFDSDIETAELTNALFDRYQAMEHGEDTD